MSPEAFRANAAGYLDASAVLIDQVTLSFSIAGQSAHPSIPAKVQTPPVFYTQLAEAKRLIAQCAGWLVDPSNNDLEKNG